MHLDLLAFIVELLDALGERSGFALKRIELLSLPVEEFHKLFGGVSEFLAFLVEASELGLDGLRFLAGELLHLCPGGFQFRNLGDRAKKGKYTQ